MGISILITKNNKEFISIESLQNFLAFEWNVICSSIKNKSYYATSNININGTKVIHYFNLVYQVVNETPVPSQISGFTLSYTKSYKYLHPIAWQANTSGTYNIKVWEEGIDENEDMNHSNDTIVISVYIKNN